MMFVCEHENFCYSELLGISNIISVVYLLVLDDQLGDILFGVFLPIGILVFLALIVTVLALNSSEKEEFKLI